MHVPLLLVILIASLLVRLVNLNYNSPFNDEAIYVVIGRLGIFQFDWGTYNASNWVAGNIYIYPALTAISYSIFGIAGSRLLNIIFGMLAIISIFSITTYLSPFKQNQKLLSGLIAAALVGGASISLYVSRIATYDMASFYFLFLSINFLLIAEHAKIRPGKWYFFSAVFLLLSFATKIITGVFLPLLIIYSFLHARGVGKEKLFFWKRYFLYSLIAGLIFYALTNFSSNASYLLGQTARESISWTQIMEFTWQNTYLVLIFWAVGSLGMLTSKNRSLWLILSLGGFLILAVHLFSHRITTLDKHLFLLISFLAIAAGIGLSQLISYVPKKFGNLSLGILALTLSFFWFFSYQKAQDFNSQWDNQSSMLSFLESAVAPGQTLLAEAGPQAILAVYDKTHPANVSTFDWFQYRKQVNDPAYAEAVRDGYFDLIELEDESKGKNSTYERVHEVVKNNLTDSYQLIYEEGGHQIFQRMY